MDGEGSSSDDDDPIDVAIAEISDWVEEKRPSGRWVEGRFVPWCENPSWYFEEADEDEPVDDWPNWEVVEGAVG